MMPSTKEGDQEIPRANAHVAILVMLPLLLQRPYSPDPSYGPVRNKPTISCRVLPYLTRSEGQLTHEWRPRNY